MDSNRMKIGTLIGLLQKVKEEEGDIQVVKACSNVGDDWGFDFLRVLKQTTTDRESGPDGKILNKTTVCLLEFGTTESHENPT